MLALILNLFRLARAVLYGARKDPEFRVLLGVLLTLLISAVVFYVNAEGWSVIDALYFSVMTISTIGYGDLVPTTAVSKLFTIVVALLGIGVFVAIVTKIVTIILEQKRDRHGTKEQQTEGD